MSRGRPAERRRAAAALLAGRRRFGREGRSRRGAAAGGTGPGDSAAGGVTGPGCPSGALFCEGFEAQPAGATPGGTLDTDGACRRADYRRHVAAVLRSKGPSRHRADRHRQGLHPNAPGDHRHHHLRPVHDVHSRLSLQQLEFTPASCALGPRRTAAGTAENSYSLSSYNGTAIEKVNSIYLRDTGTHFNDAGTRTVGSAGNSRSTRPEGAGKVTPHIWVDGRQLSLSVAGSASHGMTSPSWDPIPSRCWSWGWMVSRRIRSAPISGLTTSSSIPNG